MKSKAILLLFVLATALLSGCATGYPNGLMCTNVTIPISAATDRNSIVGSLEGRAMCHKYLFGLIASGDASVAKACRDSVSNKEIVKIKSIDYEIREWFGWGTFTVIVRGDAE